MRRYLVMILAVLLFGTGFRGLRRAVPRPVPIRSPQRLTKAVYSDCTGVSYVYDAAGNRLMRNLGKEEKGITRPPCITSTMPLSPFRSCLAWNPKGEYPP
jgi:hypothetical protein